MRPFIYERLQSLLEGTYEAFEIYGAVNTDYAGFASLSLSEFKSALANPDLTGNQLRRTIREGSREHSASNAEETWSVFMARYVGLNANMNGAEELH